MSGTPNAVHYLHTDSSYVMGDNGFGRDSLDNLLNSPQELLMMDIKRVYYQLLDREQAFYNRFGYSSADAFFKGIKNIMLEKGDILGKKTHVYNSYVIHMVNSRNHKVAH